MSLRTLVLALLVLAAPQVAETTPPQIPEHRAPAPGAGLPRITPSELKVPMFPLYKDPLELQLWTDGGKAATTDVYTLRYRHDNDVTLDVPEDQLRMGELHVGIQGSVRTPGGSRMELTACTLSLQRSVVAGPALALGSVRGGTFSVPKDVLNEWTREAYPDPVRYALLCRATDPARPDGPAERVERTFNVHGTPRSE